MSALYKRFIRVLEKWPIEKTKAGRDLGEHLREHVKLIFGSNSPVILEGNRLEREIEALDRLTKNIYQTQYPRKLSSTATGLTAEQCNQVLSSEFLEYLNDSKEIPNKK